MDISLIILAAGKSSRFKQAQPFSKMALPILGKPLICYIDEAITKAIPLKRKIVVVGESGALIKAVLPDDYLFVNQPIANGTGGAVLATLSYLDNEGYSLIVNGDMPLINTELIQKFVSCLHDKKACLAVASLDNPTGYGRVFLNKRVNIKEQCELNEKEYKNTLVNCGLYLIKNDILKQYLPQIQEEREIFLPRIFSYLKINEVSLYKAPVDCFKGVNDFFELSEAESILKMRRNKEIMKEGVYIENPMLTVIEAYVKIESGVRLLGSCRLKGNTTVAAKTIIENAQINDSIIDAETIILSSYVEFAQVGRCCQIGPYTHIRKGTIIGDECRIGNFVEVKNSELSCHVKAAHLTYIGDAFVGDGTNFGCGTVIANYDGYKKNVTTIGENVFIGCNSNLIAPVNIGADVVIAAGSTITDDVPPNALAIARSRQTIKENYRGEKDERSSTICTKRQQEDGTKDSGGD